MSAQASGWRTLVDRTAGAIMAIPEAALTRMIGLVLFAPTATVLGLSLWLTPDPSGMGTHRQLGLSGCAVLTLTGLPCPMCGMTTTFSHLAHLHLLEGVANQPFGLVLFVGTVAAAVVGGGDLFLGRGLWRVALRWIEARETAVAFGLIVGLIAGWMYKVALVREILPWAP